jgi:hypothetical protein
MQNQTASLFFFALLTILLLLTLFGIVYLYISSRSKERLALIEKGMDPNLARSDFWIQAGIVGAGSALGLIIANILPGSYGPLAGIMFAGAGLITYNLLNKRQTKNTNRQHYSK